MTIWNYLLAALASLSAEPDAVERERPRAAAAVSVAVASLCPEEAPQVTQDECEDGECKLPMGLVSP